MKKETRKRKTFKAINLTNNIMPILVYCYLLVKFLLNIFAEKPIGIDSLLTLIIILIIMLIITVKTRPIAIVNIKNESDDIVEKMNKILPYNFLNKIK